MPDRPLVCLDETSKQLIAETRSPIPAKPGQPARHDYEYERNGRANLFMIFAALGWRRIEVTDPHAAVDYAKVLKDLSDVHVPAALENRAGSGQPEHPYAGLALCRLLAPQARRLVERFEWLYTLKHGSWLDLAESKLGVIAAQCLDRRIPDKPTLADEVAAWVAKRNAHHATADWRFTTDDARVKLKSLYPQFE